MSKAGDPTAGGREHEVAAMVKDGKAVLICSCEDSPCPALDVVAEDLSSMGLTTTVSTDPAGRKPVRLDLTQRANYRDDWPANPDAGDVEGLSDVIYEVVKGTCRDIAETIMESDWLAALVQDAYDRGRDDHRTHDCCGGFVSLDAVRRKAGDDRGERIAQVIEMDARVCNQGADWRRGLERAARIARETR